MKQDDNNLIPAEEVANCEAWQMPVLDAATNVVGAAGRNNAKKKRDGGRVVPLTASKIEALREQAQAEGFAQGQQEGYQAGMQQAQAEIEQTLGQLNKLIGQLMHPLAEHEKELEQALLHLCMHIARSVVKNTFSYDEETLLEIVHQAIDALPEGTGHIRILVHPGDADLIKRAAGHHAEHWKIVADNSIASGGCVVKTEHSYIDYTSERQFQLAIESLVRNKVMSGNPVPVDVPSYTAGFDEDDSP